MPETILNYGTPDEVTITVPDGYRIVRDDEYRKYTAAWNLIVDLDRAESGRHRGDPDFHDPDGVSKGNPILPPGKQIGYTLGGRPIVVPERVADIDAWKPEGR